MQQFARSFSVTAMIAATALAITGCGLFIHSTPISKLHEQDREVLSKNGAPDTVRLTRPATVAGFDLAAGSVVQADGRFDYRIQTAGPLVVKDVTIPAGSVLELKRAQSIIVGDVYNWNGVVHLGGTYEYGMVQGQPGDRAYFEARGFSSLKLMQLSIKTPRQMGGRMLPAGSIIDLREDGSMKESFTPGEQQVLATERKEREAERRRKEERCKEICAPVTDFAANARCLGNCRN